jgi:hypothetical protein
MREAIGILHLVHHRSSEVNGQVLAPPALDGVVQYVLCPARRN